MKSYEYSQLGLENLKLVDRPDPTAGAREAVVKFHAASLNFRELLFARGLYNPHPRLPAVPGSDGAGEVVAIGKEVTRWRVGDRVCPMFMQGWQSGPLTADKPRTALGAGDLDGVFREYGAFHEDGLVRIPDYLSYEEAATLPCAGVTAWNALVHTGRIKAGDTILTLGTGGVSVFALQLAKLHGARVIATSSSNEKLARAKTLGANETINYKATPEWDREVVRLTHGVGVDNVVEVGGAGTLPRSLNAVRFDGCVCVIGVLSQGGGIDSIKILMKAIHVRGIFVGSRQMFEEMNRAIETARMKPIIDRVFPFAELPAALQYLQTGSHFGKIVVRIAAD